MRILEMGTAQSKAVVGGESNGIKVGHAGSRDEQRANFSRNLVTKGKRGGGWTGRCQGGCVGLTVEKGRERRSEDRSRKRKLAFGSD